MSGRLDLARAVADAVLYEGYLLYPYRASSDKNRSRWQFGVLGPVGAAEAGLGEADRMRLQTVVTAPTAGAELTLYVRFLQVQLRQVFDPDGTPVERTTIDGEEVLTWEEAVECEQALRIPTSAVEAVGGTTLPLHQDGAEERDGDRTVRRRWPLNGEVCARLVAHGEHAVLDITVRNTAVLAGPSKEAATRTSLIGTHLILAAAGFAFVSMTDPPAKAAEIAAGCQQDRCWPVLTGALGDVDLLLGSPIILYDYPEVAAESLGALYDSTEIDEILTLRVMTMTEQEKAEARATDPRARAIIERCEAMTPEELQSLHGILRDPRTGSGAPGRPDVPDRPEATGIRDLEPTSFDTGDVPWWSPESDESVSPGRDAVVIDGVPVARDSLVIVRPKRRADAQDLFFADQVARVTAVLSDVDGGTHVALVLADDPGADLHDGAGRYWYFAPDELEPLPAGSTNRKEGHP